MVEIDKFLQKVAQTPVKQRDADGSRVVFAMDATASRESTWDSACHLQGQMFVATEGLGNLLVQLCYYRGFNQFESTDWCDSASSLLEQMSAVRCLGGYTQIHKVLEHALQEHKRNPIRAIIFVGDALEEDADHLCHLAGQLGVFNLPLFMFQEGNEPTVTTVFQQMAQLSGGAFAPFDINSASELKGLLSAVAVFAAAGRSALDDFQKNQGLKLQWRG